MTDLTEEHLARIAETVIGLGVSPIEGCRLCRRPIPCPPHVGAEIARQALAEMEGA